MSWLTADEALPLIHCPDIDRSIQTAVYEQTFSAAACIASVGKDIYHRNIYGCPTHPPPRRLIGFDTLFDLASLTKPLGAGLAALVLSSTGRLDLGAPLSKTLPEFRHIPHFEKITVDMLLDHTSGLPAFRSFYERIAEDDLEALAHEQRMGTRKAAELMRAYVADTPLEYEPGSKVQYSDLGFMVLGWIIEGIVGKSLDVFLAREIFRPLGIADDLFYIPLEDQQFRGRLRRRTFAATEECSWREKLLQGEVHDPNAWALGGVAGHAGLFGSIDAVWRLVAHIWGSYKGEVRTFLAGGVRRFWTRSRRLRDTTRTLAWDTPTAHGSSAGLRFSRTSIGHLGFTGGSIWIDLSTDVIGVVLTNAVHPTPEGRDEAMKTFRPRVYDLIAKEGEAFMAQSGSRTTGAAAFYSGPIRTFKP